MYLPGLDLCEGASPPWNHRHFFFALLKTCFVGSITCLYFWHVFVWHIRIILGFIYLSRITDPLTLLHLVILILLLTDFVDTRFLQVLDGIFNFFVNWLVHLLRPLCVKSLLFQPVVLYHATSICSHKCSLQPSPALPRAIS